MTTVKFALDKILRDQYDFCCLCYNGIGEADQCYHIYDEVVFNKKNTKNLFEILSCVLGSEVLNYLTSFISVCHTCAEKAINAYKFILDCRKNTLQLCNILTVLYDYFEYSNRSYNQMNICKTFILCLDSELSIKDYYNSKLIKKPTEILKVLQAFSQSGLEKYNTQYTSTIKIKKDFDADNYLPKEEFNENVTKNNRVKLIDIIYDKNNLSQFKCKICHNSFSRGPNLKKHYYRVHAPKVYKCFLCLKSFGSANFLKMHQNHHHCAAVCCTKCGKIFSSVYALISHEKRHKIRHVCQHCGKVYKTKHAYQSHIDNFHYGGIKSKQNFICDCCGKKYSQKSAIRVHIQFEHGNGKFSECDWCKKKFSSVSHLKEHIITHTKEKRFSCEMCGGRFATKMSLLYHTRTHTGEKPYQCQHCDSSFLSASRRMTHVKQHHMPAVQECDVCHKKFKLRSYLLRHRQKHFDPNSKLRQKTVSV